jgi:RimJ/RimL family protein N-acetyltransferase
VRGEPADLAERAGYEREGLMRGHQEIGGQRRAMLLYATRREDSPSPTLPRELTA